MTHCSEIVQPINGISRVKNTNKSIRISSKSPVDWLSKLKMANPAATAAKSSRLTGNEGPPESKQTTYHEIRHPERQLSHQRWDRFNGPLKLVVSAHLEWILVECGCFTTNDQWRVVTPSSSSCLTSHVLVDTASRTWQVLKLYTFKMSTALQTNYYNLKAWPLCRNIFLHCHSGVIFWPQPLIFPYTLQAMMDGCAWRRCQQRHRQTQRGFLLKFITCRLLFI